MNYNRMSEIIDEIIDEIHKTEAILQGPLNDFDKYNYSNWLRYLYKYLDDIIQRRLKMMDR